MDTFKTKFRAHLGMEFLLGQNSNFIGRDSYVGYLWVHP